MITHQRSQSSPLTEHATKADGPAQLPQAYRHACWLVVEGRHDEARRFYAEIPSTLADSRVQALTGNDLAVLDALAGDLDAARRGLEAAIALDALCQPARINLDWLRAELTSRLGGSERDTECGEALSHSDPRCPIRVAILSFLFNWPATGGGNIHTVELADFLARAGYEVHHYYPRFPDWGIGSVTAELPMTSEALEFDAASWNLAEILARFRAAVDRFGPDYAIITDAWNMKPLLAEAVRDYPFFLRFQAQECLCPLNNLRLLARGPDQVAQCPRNQLATPDVCRLCVAGRGLHSGSLHRCERDLAGVGTPEYDEKLRWSLQDAKAVLALNPLTAALLEPYARHVRVVPWGMDPARFPWPAPEEPRGEAPGKVATLFMAAVQGEFIKGFHVAHAACRLLRQGRADFELVVTFDPPGWIDEFTRSVGWCSQADLPRHYRAADICLVPTIAQEGLSRTSVEAMASGIPVIASRIGGLPFTVSDGATGVLCDPGDPADLARQIARLLDDPPLRRQMGLAGRRRFEEEFTWESVIERYYRPILACRGAIARAGARS